MSVTHEAKQHAAAAERAALPWVERLARLGYAAKGIVYAILGLLALQAARGTGSAQVDQRSAFNSILSQPFGQFLLGIVAVGLGGYALWRLIEAVIDPEGEGSGKKAVVRRVGYAVSGISYAVLAYGALQLDMGRSSGGGNPKDITAGLMQHSWGRWLVLVIGLAILAAGLAQFYQAYKVNFERRFKAGKLNAQQKRWLITIGRIGYAAKGLVYALVGLFLAQAGWQYDPQKAGGLSDALGRLAGQPYGTVLLAAAALGLLAYGAYALVLSQVRQITVA